MNAAPTINGSPAARPMRPGFYDPLADEPETVTVSPSAESSRGERTDGRLNAGPVKPEPRVMVEFLSPSQMKAVPVPEGSKPVGDFHVERGSPFVLGVRPVSAKPRSRRLGGGWRDGSRLVRTEGSPAVQDDDSSGGKRVGSFEK